MRRRVLLALAFAPAISSAQVATIPETGARLRVESSAVVGQRATGTLVAMNQGFVTLGIGKGETKLTVPWSRLSGVDVVTGRNQRRGATFGALVGGGAALVTVPRSDAFASDGSTSNSGRVLLAAALPVAGAIVGLRFGPAEWEPLTWRPAMDTVLPEGEALRLVLTPRARLLVRHDDKWVKGRLVSDVGDSLTVRTLRATRTMAWSDIAQVNIQESRSRARGAALWGTLGGVYAIARLARGPESTITEKQQIIGVSLLTGAAVGAIVGRGTWTRVPIPAR